MDAERIARKIKGYCHQEFNKTSITSIEGIKKRIAGGEDILGRKNVRLAAIPVDERFPQYLREHQEKYAKFILPYKAWNYWLTLCIESLRRTRKNISRWLRKKCGRSSA